MTIETTTPQITDNTMEDINLATPEHIAALSLTVATEDAIARYAELSKSGQLPKGSQYSETVDDKGNYIRKVSTGYGAPTLTAETTSAEPSKVTYVQKSFSQFSAAESTISWNNESDVVDRDSIDSYGRPDPRHSGPLSVAGVENNALRMNKLGLETKLEAVDVQKRRRVGARAMRALLRKP